MTLNRLALCLATIVAAVSIPISAQAQLDLLKRGKDALQSIRGLYCSTATTSESIRNVKR